MTWQAELIRMTAFPVEPLTSLNDAWWRDQLGTLPEQTNRQMVAIQGSDVGSFGRGELVLSQQPVRVDWLHRPRAEAAGMPPTLPPLAAPPDLGELGATLPEFRKVVTS